jgi:hypothetical protein
VVPVEIDEEFVDRPVYGFLEVEWLGTDPGDARTTKEVPSPRPGNLLRMDDEQAKALHDALSEALDALLGNGDVRPVHWSDFAGIGYTVTSRRLTTHTYLRVP